MSGVDSSPAGAKDAQTGDRLRIGGATIDRLADIQGIAWPSTALFAALKGDVLKEAAAKYPQAADAQAGTIALSFNSYIVKTADVLCLIDAGIGNDKERPDRPAWHRRQGDFMDRLAALGYAPEQFDLVVNTHLHADHVGWNTVLVDGTWQPAFPNARYVVAQSELAHWSGLYRSDSHTLHGAYADSVAPIRDAGLYDAVVPPAEIAPGLWLEPAPGHTLGMAVVRLKTQEGDVLFMADVLHSPIQLTSPEMTSNFCVEPGLSRATRLRLLDECAGTQTIVAPYHFPPPAFGRIVRSGATYVLEPLT